MVIKPKTNFQAFLWNMGFADSRLGSLDKGVKELHNSLCYLDRTNAQLFFGNFYNVRTLVNAYGQAEDLNRFNAEWLQTRDRVQLNDSDDCENCTDFINIGINNDR